MDVSQGLAYRPITEKVIGAAMEVHRTLGRGFLEKVYENALVAELQDLGFKVEQQKAINVYYKGRVVGEYIADILVEDVVILELKVAEQLTNVHYAQVLNYLIASEIEVGLLLNFHPPSLEWKRIVNQPNRVCSNSQK